jgi:hypothetical protein
MSLTIDQICDEVVEFADRSLSHPDPVGRLHAAMMLLDRTIMKKMADIRSRESAVTVDKMTGAGS